MEGTKGVGLRSRLRRRRAVALGARIGPPEARKGVAYLDIGVNTMVNWHTLFSAWSLVGYEPTPHLILPLPGKMEPAKQLPILLRICCCFSPERELHFSPGATPD